MDWLLRLQMPTRSRSDETEFALWLRRSPAHERVWLKACRTWDVLGSAVPPTEDLDTSKDIPIADRRATPGWRRNLRIAAVAVCLVGIASLVPLMMQPRPDFATATGEIRSITLEDGSIIELAAASAIAVDFSDGQRRVQLTSGQAFFDVQHDTDRPFRVDAGGAHVEVFGTAFDINVTNDRTTVQLARGAVGFSTGQTATAMTLSPGDVVTLNRESGEISRDVIDVQGIASWRDQRLFVHDVPISDVVEELQRYHPAWIKIAGGGLAEQRITGLYDLSDPDRALEALVTPYGGKVHYLFPYLRILAPY